MKLTEDSYMEFIKLHSFIEELAVTLGKQMVSGFDGWVSLEDDVLRYAPEGAYVYEIHRWGDGFHDKKEFLVPIDALIHPDKYDKIWEAAYQEKNRKNKDAQKTAEYKRYLELKEKFEDG
jgi:hypothetical protein